MLKMAVDLSCSPLQVHLSSLSRLGDLPQGRDHSLPPRIAVGRVVEGLAAPRAAQHASLRQAHLSDSGLGPGSGAVELT